MTFDRQAWLWLALGAGAGERELFSAAPAAHAVVDLFAVVLDGAK